MQFLWESVRNYCTNTSVVCSNVQEKSVTIISLWNYTFVGIFLLKIRKPSNFLLKKKKENRTKQNSDWLVIVICLTCLYPVPSNLNYVNLHQN